MAANATPGNTREIGRILQGRHPLGERLRLFRNLEPADPPSPFHDATQACRFAGFSRVLAHITTQYGPVQSANAAVSHAIPLTRSKCRGLRRNKANESSFMKVFAVVCRDAAWHAVVPGTGQTLGSYEEKSVIVGWTCAYARKHGGEVHVHDENGDVEDVYAFVRGSEQR
jgi:hypothetical protein